MKELQIWKEVLDNTRQDMRMYGVRLYEVADVVGNDRGYLTKIFSAKVIPSCVKWIKIHTAIHNLIEVEKKRLEELKKLNPEKYEDIPY